MAARSWMSQTTDVMFLGAGFSRAATANQAPLMHDFFDRFDDRQYWTLAKFLTECFESPAKANVEEAMLRLDQLATSPFSAGIDPFIGQCRKRHADVREELDRYTLFRLNSVPVSWRWAAKILFWASERTTVITTNYDNVAERILSKKPGLRHRVQGTNCPHCKMCAILERGCACESSEGGEALPDPPGALLKLHGSIAWRTCLNDACGSNQCLVPHQHCAPFKDEPCNCCGESCRPVLVMPSMAKTFERFPQIHRMWDAAFRQLQVARRIFIFGFSFPTSDAVITEMFRCTVGRSKSIEAVAVADIDPAARVARLREILPNANAIEFEELKCNKDASAPEWFAEWERLSVGAMAPRALKGHH